jgi:hypothetical protein
MTFSARTRSPWSITLSGAVVCLLSPEVRPPRAPETIGSWRELHGPAIVLQLATADAGEVSPYDISGSRRRHSDERGVVHRLPEGRLRHPPRQVLSVPRGLGVLVLQVARPPADQAPAATALETQSSFNSKVLVGKRGRNGGRDEKVGLCATEACRRSILRCADRFALGRNRNWADLACIRAELLQSGRRGATTTFTP